MYQTYEELIDIVRRFLDDPETGWAVSVFGAIAEFHPPPGGAVSAFQVDRGVEATTEGGAMRIVLAPDTRFIPYETLAKRPEAWQHGAVFCLPSDRAAVPKRTGLTELGADAEAVRPEDRNAILFDLGLGLAAVEAMVRTDDADLIGRMRKLEGEDILNGRRAHDAFGLLVDTSPHRVFRSRLGRVEVWTPIPGPDGTTQPGPHTHILPKLLAAGRTHSATIALPEGLSPCFTMYPPNPMMTPFGDPTPFDRAAFERFRDLAERYGLMRLSGVKHATRMAVARGVPPTDPAALSPGALSRDERIAVRVTLRQLAQDVGESDILAGWRAMFEPSSGKDPDIEPEV